MDKKNSNVLDKAAEQILLVHKKKTGMELLQLAIVIVISVGLIAVVTLLASSVGSQIEKAATQVSTFTGWDYLEDK